MAQINITTGQGITQAIASQLGMSKSDCKKVSLSQWQQVMTLVNQNNTQNKAQNKPSIFSGGNNVQNINRKESWKTDFVVHPNDTIEIEQSFWDKIVAILKPSAVKQAQTTEATQKVEEVTSQPKAENADETQEVASAAQKPEVKTQGEELLDFTEDISSMRFSELKTSDKNFSVIDKAKWTNLINSGDNAQIDSAYKKAFTDLGASFTSALDNKGGNGDGSLTLEEFKASGLYDSKNGDAAIEKAFKNLDINGDKKIDAKEMAAFLRLADNSVNPSEKGGDNARLDAYSLTARFMAMENPEMKNNIQTAYKHLFE